LRSFEPGFESRSGRHFYTIVWTLYLTEPLAAKNSSIIIELDFERPVIISGARERLSRKQVKAARFILSETLSGKNTPSVPV
jgi:hypothetical protein